MVKRQERRDVRRWMSGRLVLGWRSRVVLSGIRGERRRPESGHSGRGRGRPRCGRGAFGALAFVAVVIVVVVVGRLSATGAAYGRRTGSVPASAAAAVLAVRRRRGRRAATAAGRPSSRRRRRRAVGHRRTATAPVRRLNGRRRGRGRFHGRFDAVIDDFGTVTAGVTVVRVTANAAVTVLFDRGRGCNRCLGRRCRVRCARGVLQQLGRR